MIYAAILLCCATPYLLLIGEHIAKRIRARRTAAIRQAWTGSHNREHQ